MDSKKYTPKLVAEENLCFSIPLYQRLFAWGEPQVKGLLEDLFNHFKETEKPYYLGMLSCIKMSGFYDLIDGQQRFTVMTLFGVVFQQYDEQWKKFLSEGKRLYFRARSKDQEYIKTRIDQSKNVAEINTKMEAAINVIKEFLSNQERFPNDSARSAFADKVYNRLSFFFSELPASYNTDPRSLNKYFEAMNAYGKGLEQHEILKVELMRNEEDQEYLTRVWNAVSEMGRPLIKRNEENESIDEYRQRYINAIQLCQSGNFKEALKGCRSSFDKIDSATIAEIEARPRSNNESVIEEDTDNVVISFPEFLMMAIDIHLHLGGSYTFYKKDLLRTFKENPITDKKAFYGLLLHYRLLLDYYIITIEEDSKGNKYEVLMRDKDDREKSAKTALTQYQSMMYVSQTPIYNWLKPLLIKLDGYAPESASSKDILVWLKDIDDALRSLPKYVDMMSYDKNVDRYWFWRLDYYLWENRDKFFSEESDREIVSNYKFRANRSIEHIHPQHQTNNDEWPIKDVHTFGNLAMISQSFNSEQSDDPVTVKFARIKDQAANLALQSIKMFLMYNDADKNPAGWNREIMLSHQQKMFELLTQSFKR